MTQTKKLWPRESCSGTVQRAELLIVTLTTTSSPGARFVGESRVLAPSKTTRRFCRCGVEVDHARGSLQHSSKRDILDKIPCDMLLAASRSNQTFGEGNCGVSVLGIRIQARGRPHPHRDPGARDTSTVPHARSRAVPTTFALGSRVATSSGARTTHVGSY